MSERKILKVGPASPNGFIDGTLTEYEDGGWDYDGTCDLVNGDSVIVTIHGKEEFRKTVNRSGSLRIRLEFTPQ